MSSYVSISSMGRERKRERERKTKSPSKVLGVSVPSSRTFENQRVVGPGATKTMRCLSILLGPAGHHGGAMIHDSWNYRDRWSTDEVLWTSHRFLGFHSDISIRHYLTIWRVVLITLFLGGWVYEFESPTRHEHTHPHHNLPWWCLQTQTAQIAGKCCKTKNNEQHV